MTREVVDVRGRLVEIGEWKAWILPDADEAHHHVYHPEETSERLSQGRPSMMDIGGNLFSALQKQELNPR